VANAGAICHFIRKSTLMSSDVIIRFDEVTFGYSHTKKLLDETSFSIREGAKLTLMGQNGAGKSTLFKLLTKELKVTGGQMHIKKGVSIGTGLQVIPKEKLTMSVEEFFESAFFNPPSDIERRVQEILEVVNLNVPIDQIMVKKVSQFSGTTSPAPFGLCFNSKARYLVIR
jgi:ATPase subunit of ABC transporter with duplicated ATPase domains